MRSLSVQAVAAICVVVSGVEVLDNVAANPVRKVVTMLQKMKIKVEEEAKKDETLNEKYTCYCKKNGNELDDAIAASTAKIPEVQSALGENVQQKEQLSADLESARNDRTAAKNAISSATSIREKEAAAFEAEKSEADANIGALAKAIVAIENGMSGGFLQTKSAQILRDLLRTANNIFEGDSRQELTSFLSASQKAGYSPRSGEIVGILKGIKEQIEKNLSESTASEKSSASEYGALMNAKKKEIAALTKSIETKTLRIGEVAVAIANMKNDLSDTETALLENKQFKADLESNCGARAKEWEVITKTRSEELVALAETIKILTDDDALELFKKTLPSASASFVQMRSRSAKAKEHAYQVLKSAKGAQTLRTESFDLIMLALRGKKIGFEKVINMIDSMVDELKAEQTEDENKKEYCGTQLDSSDDKRKSLERDVKDSDTIIADTREKLATIESEIKTILGGINELDKSVAEASEQRKEEHEAYLELVSSNAAATELLGFAKNRLQKFYNPKLHVPETAFVQVSTHVHERVPAQPAPESVGAYRKSQESSGVIAMLDLLIKDLAKETTEAETQEKDAQSDFEGTMRDATQKRAADTKTLEGKKSAKADVEVFLDNSETGRTSSVKELAATTKVIAMLHSECDWLLKYFDTRKDARSSEIDALVQAKAVLNGADYSFLQTMKQSPENQLAKEMTHDLEMNFNKIAPFGKEDTAKELQDHAAKTQNTLVDAVENAEVAEIKRAVFRALTRLRAATIKEFDTIARLETQAIDAYNDAHHYRAENPLAHLHEDEAPVETDKLKSFH
jgi:hypothetical protein|eukprot:TRINITY_DN79_c0_g2_i4.p1 TRINITY_DN79_c0_g2~~TRINITY_DN79_c0_g2_i4.p1  ORF type:complete len:802 (-),score=177.95 TRINITY_DN79_c0_g2_i4:160-2565(-)